MRFLAVFCGFSGRDAPIHAIWHGNSPYMSIIYAASAIYLSPMGSITGVQSGALPQPHDQPSTGGRTRGDGASTGGRSGSGSGHRRHGSRRPACGFAQPVARGCRKHCRSYGRHQVQQALHNPVSTGSVKVTGTEQLRQIILSGASPCSTCRKSSGCGEVRWAFAV